MPETSNNSFADPYQLFIFVDDDFVDVLVLFFVNPIQHIEIKARKAHRGA